MPLEALFRMAGAQCVADHFVPYDDVAPTLRELSAMSVPCVLMSAGWSSIEERKAEAVGFHGPLLLGEDLDVPLTSPRAFARVAEILKLPADRIWFVGTDARKEILPAQAAGLHTVWLNRNHAEFPALREPPEVTITTFAALLDALSEPYTRGLLAMRYILRTVLDWRPGHFVSGGDPVLGKDEPSDAC
jgi:FMN phosphatase YigB (HAD superfamily)